MSTLPFNITQFFPFLNHQLLSLIMDKAGVQEEKKQKKKKEKEKEFK